MEDSQEWQDIDDIQLPTMPYPVLAQEDLDHKEAQRHLKEEQERLSQGGDEVFQTIRLPKDGLVGPPLNLEQCKNLVPDSFVRNHLFRPVDRSKQKNPKRKYPPKLSNLQHVGLSKILVERFVEKTKSSPNNKQIPLYFIQQLFCEEFLNRQVDWNDKGPSGGVALGRPADRKKARLEGRELPRTKPIVLTQEEHLNIQAFAAEGVTLATQGLTAPRLIAQCQSLQTQVNMLMHRNQQLEAKLLRYEEKYGPLPDDSPRFGFEELMTNPTVNLNED